MPTEQCAYGTVCLRNNVPTEQCAYGTVCLRNSVPKEQCAYGTMCLRNNMPTEQCAYGTMCLRNNMPTEQYAYGTMCLRNNVPTEQCAYGTMCLRNNMPTEQFAYGAMCLRNNMSTEQCAYGTVCLGNSVLKSAKLLTVLRLCEVWPNLSKKVRHITVPSTEPWPPPSTSICKFFFIFQPLDAAQCHLLTAPANTNIWTCIARFLSAFQIALLTYSKNQEVFCVPALKPFVKKIHFKLPLYIRNLQQKCVREGRLGPRS